MNRLPIRLSVTQRKSRRASLIKVVWPVLSRPGEIRIDVTEKDKSYEVRAEIPGAKKEDIRVKVEATSSRSRPMSERTRKRSPPAGWS